MRLSTFALGLSLILSASAASAANYKVHLTSSGGGGFPGIDAGSKDHGDGTFTFDEGTKKLSGTVTFDVTPAFSAALTWTEADAGMFGGQPKDIKRYTAADKLQSPFAIKDIELTANEITALAAGNVSFEVSGFQAKAEGKLVPDNGGSTDPDASTTNPDAGSSTNSDSGSNPDPGNPGNPDPGNPGSTDPDAGGPTTTPTETPVEDDSTSSSKSGCSVVHASATDSLAYGSASVAGLLGLAFLARRRRNKN